MKLKFIAVTLTQLPLKEQLYFSCLKKYLKDQLKKEPSKRPDNCFDLPYFVLY